MKILILTNPKYHKWIWYQIKDRLSGHDIHVWSDGAYPFELLYGGYDIGISFMYWYKVPAKEVKSRPWFNFHPAPLPEYKGRNLCYHAIMNGEKYFGATVHYMDENFDTGDIIEVFRFAVHDWWNAEDLSNKAIEISKRVFEEYLPLILENTVFPRLPNRRSPYYKKTDILEEVPVRPDEPFGQFVRAVTYKGFYPRIDIGGVKYKIVKDE